MDEPKTLTIELHCSSEYVKMPLADAVAWLDSMLNSVPEEYRDNAWFDVSLDYGIYDDPTSLDFQVYYNRLETEEESAKRLVRHYVATAPRRLQKLRPVLTFATICGASLGSVVPGRAEAHVQVQGRWPDAAVVQAVVRPLQLVEHIPVFDRSEDEDGRATRPDCGNHLCTWLTVANTISRYRTPGRNRREIQVLQTTGRSKLGLFVEIGQFYGAPVPDLMRWGAARVLYNHRASYLPQELQVALRMIGSIRDTDGIHKEVGPQLTARGLASLPKRPDQKYGRYDRREERQYGEPQAQAGQPIGLRNLIYGGPLRTKIGVFAIIRIIAAGLVMAGWFLCRSIYPETRLAGWLIGVVGVLLFGGLVELI